MPYFDEPVGRVKIQITSKNSQRCYTTKRLIRDLSSNTPNCCLCGRISRIFIYRECVTEVCDEARNWHEKCSQLISQQQENKANWVLWFRPSHHWRNLFDFSRRKKIIFRSSKWRIISSFLISIKRNRRNQIRFDKQSFFS